MSSKSVPAYARQLRCSWETVNDAVPAKGRGCPIADGHRLDGVRAVGVDGRVWRCTPEGNRYVTVIVDLTPRGDGRPARLPDMVEGRSEKAFAGCRRAAARQVSKAVEVLDPFHIVKLAGDRLTKIAA